MGAYCEGELRQADGRQHRQDGQGEGCCLWGGGWEGAGDQQAGCDAGDARGALAQGDAPDFAGARVVGASADVLQQERRAGADQREPCGSAGGPERQEEEHLADAVDRGVQHVAPARRASRGHRHAAVDRVGQAAQDANRAGGEQPAASQPCQGPHPARQPQPQQRQHVRVRPPARQRAADCERQRQPPAQPHTAPGIHTPVHGRPAVQVAVQLREGRRGWAARRDQDPRERHPEPRERPHPGQAQTPPLRCGAVCPGRGMRRTPG